MDKNEKFLRRLSAKEFSIVQDIVSRILVGDLVGLDIKKLSGYHNAYRVRVGRIRIVYMQLPDDTEILYIGNRNEKTYKKF